VLPIWTLAVVLAASPGSLSAQERVRAAYGKLDAADQARRAGRLGAAWAGYLGLLQDFPTWWIPELKAATLARDMGMPRTECLARVERVLTLSPDGTLAFMVRDLMDLEDKGLLPSMDAYAPNDPNLDRILLARAKALSASGRHEEAAAEYRRLLERRGGCVAARGLARELMALGRAEEAEAVLRQGATPCRVPLNSQFKRPVSARNGAAGVANENSY